MSQWGGNYRNLGAADMNPSFTLVGIPFVIGGLSLTVTQIRIKNLVDHDSSDFIDRVRVWCDGVVKYDSGALAWDDLSAGTNTFDITDCNPTEELMVYFDCTCTSLAELQFRGVQAECYYSA